MFSWEGHVCLSYGLFQLKKTGKRPGPEVIKLFSCSTQLSTKFQLLIKTKILTNGEVYCFMSLRCCIYHANKCLNANNCWHFNIYEQDKFHAQLSWAWKKFYNLWALPEKILLSGTIIILTNIWSNYLLIWLRLILLQV